MRGLGPFLRDAWFLAKPYFRSEEKRSAWLLLIVVVGMNLSLVGMQVVLSYWNNAFTNTFQTKDWNGICFASVYLQPYREWSA